MKISYNSLKRLKKDIKSPEDVTNDLIMHTAEVEKIHYPQENLKDVFIWLIKSARKHPNSDRLNCTQVEVNWKILPIVCGAPNVKEGLKVAVALVGTKLKENLIIWKTKIRWEVSEWMICSEDELWLVEERQDKILELPKDAPLWISMRDYLGKNEAILEVDNKAINHRPDLFSHIWILREIYAIWKEKFEYNYEDKDFSWLKELSIKNEIPEVVPRYIGLKVENVENTDSPFYIKEVLQASDCSSKWLLIDLSNYSLYFYGQPTHIFDSDKIKWGLIIRYAKKWEKILALDNKEYELIDKDMVIADEEKVVAIAWIIWWKNSCVDDNTKNIIIESANFDHCLVRISGKRLWIRTDALNIFEKDILKVSAKWWVSLIASELEKAFKNLKFISYKDCYKWDELVKKIDYDLDFINRLIWNDYKDVENILENIWIKIENNKLIIPVWRKDLNNKADIAEEIARIDWYNNVKSQIPNIELGAIIQGNTYKTKKLSRSFFVWEWFYDMYTYSFVWEDLARKCEMSLKNLIPLKNSLSEDLTHMKSSLIPNLLMSLEKNRINFRNLKLFEVEKVFRFEKDWIDITENYDISGVIESEKDIVYYEIQDIVLRFFKYVWIDNYEFKTPEKIPEYAHKTRTSTIIVRWKPVWFLWEIKPIVTKNFDIKNRIWFFEINLEKIKESTESIIKTKQMSEFQASSFDISFLINKDNSWSNLKRLIKKTNPNIIEKVELFDIYEDKEKLWDKRSLSFKIFLQKIDSEINDKEKNELIDDIIKRAVKSWAIHR